MQVEVSLKRMQTNFGECGFSGFGDFAPFHLPSKWPKFFWTMDYSPWWNRLKKFMLIKVNVECMHAKCDGIASQVFEILLHLFSFKFLMVHGLLYNISSSQFCYSYIIIFSCLLFLHHFNLLTDFNCINFYVLCPFVPVCLSFLTALSLLHSCSFCCLLLALSESSLLHKLFLFLPIVLIECL